MIEQQFVEYVVKELVDNPDKVTVNRTEDSRGVLLELTVDPSDLGRVIGRHGSTAQSLRNILRALGVKNGARYNLKIVDTDKNSKVNDEAITDLGESVDTVENTDPDNVENVSSRAEKLRQGIAELEDLDI